MIQLKRPFLLLSPPGVYPDTPLFRSAFELAAGLQTAQAGLNAAWQQWPPAKGQAGTRLAVGCPRNAQIHDSQKALPVNQDGAPR